MTTYPVLVGPMTESKLYLVTRQPLQTAGSINPFGSLKPKFWMNYALIYIIFVLISFCIHLSLKHRLSLRYCIDAIISPSMSNGNILLGPSLIAFAFWTFNILYGVDLWDVLSGNPKDTGQKDCCFQELHPTQPPVDRKPGPIGI